MSYKKMLWIGILLSISAVTFQILHHDNTVRQLKKCVVSFGTISESCARPIIRNLRETRDIPTLMNELEAEYTPVQCHRFGHLVGELSGLSTWETIMRTCSYTCGFSCVHGATQSQFQNSDKVLDMIEKKIMDQPTLIETAKEMCADGGVACHAVGHGLARTINDAEEALAICDQLNNIDTADFGCPAGVFMEIFISTSTELVQPVTGGESGRDMEAFLFPCNTIATKYRIACYRDLFDNQNKSFERLGITSPSKQIDIRLSACSSVTDSQERSACYKSVGKSLAWPVRLEDDMIKKTCARAPDRLAEQDCVSGFVYSLAAYLHQHEAALFCLTITDEETKKRCLFTLFVPAPNWLIYVPESVARRSKTPPARRNIENSKRRSPNETTASETGRR